MTAPRRTTNNRPSLCLELPSGAPRRRQHTRRRGRQGVAQTGRASGVPAKEANRIASGVKAGKEKAVHAREEEGARRGQKARDPGRRRRTTATRKIVAREQTPLDEDRVDNQESAPCHDGRRDTRQGDSVHYTASWTAGASADPEPNGEDDLGEKKAMETVVQDVIGRRALVALRGRSEPETHWAPQGPCAQAA